MKNFESVEEAWEEVQKLCPDMPKCLQRQVDTLIKAHEAGKLTLSDLGMTEEEFKEASEWFIGGLNFLIDNLTEIK